MRVGTRVGMPASASVSTRVSTRVLLIVLALLLLYHPVHAQDGGTSNTPNVMIHIVQRGETLSGIAQQYGTTVEIIVQTNGLTTPDSIDVGQRLLIPNASPDTPGIPIAHIIQPGDSLYSLSLRYGTTAADIARLNRVVNPSRLFVGLLLTVPQGSASERRVTNGTIHTVRVGETPYRIAFMYRTTSEALMRENGLTPPVKLFPGQRLVIPRADGAELTDVPPPFTQIALDAAPAQQGRTINLRITTAVPVRIEGTFMSKNLAVESDANRTSHRVVFGVFAFAQPGLYTLDLIATDDGGTQNLFRRSIEVMDGGYSSETIVLTADQNSLLDPNVTRPEADRILAMVSNVTPQRYYTGAFGLPCPAPVTSQFGTRRSYNGGPFDQMHGGTDFAGAPGSAIYAPAPGVVVMAEALNVRGNAVLIDHGWGVFTGYWHLQEIGVRVGDTVQQGQIIGTIGSTGRVTGPHLHWELFVSGVQVDPMQWVVQDFAK